MLPISMSSSTTNRRAFPISTLQLLARRVQIASLPCPACIAAHCLNMLLCYFPLKRAESAQAKPMFRSEGADFFHTFPRQVFAQGVILKASFQRQGNGLSHTGVGLPWRESKIKVE